MIEGQPGNVHLVRRHAEFVYQKRCTNLNDVDRSSINTKTGQNEITVRLAVKLA